MELDPGTTIAVAFRICDSPPPAVIPVRLTDFSPDSSATVTGATASMVGGSLTAVTFTTMVLSVTPLSDKVLRIPSCPASMILTVSVAVPDLFAAG